MSSGERAVERYWSVPVSLSQVGEAGRHFDLVADPATCAAVAAHAGLAALPRLEAHFDVTRHGRAGLRVAGQVFATVEQLCVVTLEPVVNEIAEPVDLVFVPDAGTASNQLETEVPAEDEPEELVGGQVDLGSIAVEFLVLGIDPYPRRPDAVLEVPANQQNELTGPFAGLASLKRGQAPG